MKMKVGNKIGEMTVKFVAPNGGYVCINEEYIKSRGKDNRGRKPKEQEYEIEKDVEGE